MKQIKMYGKLYDEFQILKIRRVLALDQIFIIKRRAKFIDEELAFSQ